MKKTIRYSILAVAALLSVGCMMSCSDDIVDTQQFQGGVSLNVFGPCPVARGGELQFIGSGLDKIKSVEIPGSEPITDIQRISDKEIRVIVPQTAEVGYVTLNYADGQIRTKTPITYSEPVSIEAISPSKVRPGERIELKGDYLNLMHQVCFSFVEGGDSVNVSQDDFLTHDRKSISVIVPETAVTGPVTVSDAKAVAQRIKSENDLIVIAPSVTNIADIQNAKSGMSVTIKGTDLDLVKRVLMPNGKDVDYTYNANESSISFTLPDDITDGVIYLMPASGIKIEAANVSVVEPSNVKISPEKDIRTGDKIVITGDNVDQIASVNVPNVAEAIAVQTTSANEVSFIFPAKGQTGTLTMNLRNGKTLSSRIITAKPEVRSFTPSSVPAAGEFTMKGKDLDLVCKVTFIGDITVDVHPTSATEITMRADANAKSGPLTLIMTNGESVRTFPLTIKTPECCYISGLVTENLIAGELFEATVGNGDKLTDVRINGMPCQYIINGSRLFINIPTNVSGETTFKLISSNGEIEYKYYVINSAHQEIDLLDEPFDMGTWSGFFRVYKQSFDGVPAGAKLVFYLDSRAFTQVQINDANWSQLTILQGDQGVSRLEYELSSDTLNAILTTSDGWSETALCIQGEGATILRATIEYDL